MESLILDIYLIYAYLQNRSLYAIKHLNLLQYGTRVLLLSYIAHRSKTKCQVSLFKRFLLKSPNRTKHVQLVVPSLTTVNLLYTSYLRDLLLSISSGWLKATVI